MKGVLTFPNCLVYNDLILRHFIRLTIKNTHKKNHFSPVDISKKLKKKTMYFFSLSEYTN